MNAPAMVVQLSTADLEALLHRVVDDALAEHQAQPRPALLTQEELSRELGISSRSVFSLRQDGLPTVLVGDSPRFELADVLAWLKKQRPALVRKGRAA